MTCAPGACYSRHKLAMEAAVLVVFGRQSLCLGCPVCTRCQLARGARGDNCCGARLPGQVVGSLSMVVNGVLYSMLPLMVVVIRNTARSVDFASLCFCIETG